MDRWFNKDLERKDLPKNVNREELYGFLNGNKVLEDEKYVAIYEDLLENEDWYKEFFKEKLLLNEKFDNRINLLCNKVLMESFENLIIVFTNINRHILSTNISCF